ncbi:hypothetical protein EBR03_02980 [bacterium]|nr:hypothetical protein [bacterium]
MGIGQLIKNVSDDIDGAIKSLLGSSKEKTYPDSPGGTEKIKITNVLTYNEGEWKSSQGYAFHVVRASKDGKEKNEKDWKEFKLQINPQELTQDEIFAIQVTPTFRGVVVEHQGVTLKDIVIQGVTGISPLRREGGAKKNSGDPVLAAGHSGFREFHELRSYFRAYVEAKRLDGAGNPDGELRLVFKNYKDNEFIYVEPQKFTMKRSASKPFLYEYQIAMKGIGVAGVSKAETGNWLTSITDAIDSAFDLIEYATQIINGSIGLIRRTERNVTNTILEPLRSVNSALSAIRGGKAALFGPFGITRRFVSQLNSNLASLEANLNEVFGVDISKYNAATGRVSTLKSTTSRTPTYQELKVLNAIASAKRGLLIILQDKALFVEDSDAQSTAVEGIFQKRLVTDGVVTTTTGDLVLDRPLSVRTVLIDGADTVQTLAARELGDPDKFREIVLLNNLKPPYISPLGGAGVLKPGDKILIPQLKPTLATSGVAQNVEYQITKFLTQSEKNLGVDLRIDENNDLVFANFGDFDLYAGIDNIAQAILIRLGLEPGSLKRHPELGVGLEIGRKVKNVGEIRNRITNTLVQDPRIDSVPYLNVQQEGNATLINMIVKIRNLNEPVPLEIVV